MLHPKDDLYLFECVVGAVSSSSSIVLSRLVWCIMVASGIDKMSSVCYRGKGVKHQRFRGGIQIPGTKTIHDHLFHFWISQVCVCMCTVCVWVMSVCVLCVCMCTAFMCACMYYVYCVCIVCMGVYCLCTVCVCVCTVCVLCVYCVCKVCVLCVYCVCNMCVMCV